MFICFSSWHLWKFVYFRIFVYFWYFLKSSEVATVFDIRFKFVYCDRFLSTNNRVFISTKNFIKQLHSLILFPFDTRNTSRFAEILLERIHIQLSPLCCHLTILYYLKLFKLTWKHFFWHEYFHWLLLVLQSWSWWNIYLNLPEPNERIFFHVVVEIRTMAFHISRTKIFNIREFQRKYFIRV